MINRSAAGVWRWARAASPGIMICRPANIELVVAIIETIQGFRRLPTSIQYRRHLLKFYIFRYFSGAMKLKARSAK